MSQAAVNVPIASPAAGRDLSRLSYRQLPVLAGTKRAIQELGGRVTLSTGRIAVIALGDPGLALQLLREANVQAHERHELEVSSVSHAVVLLGMEQTLDFIARLRTVESIKQRQRRDGALHALARAAHAGALARRWTKRRDDNTGETAAAAALTRHAAELVLWSGDTGAVELFSRLHDAGAARGQLESELLGCSLEALGERLADEARLPLTLRCAMDDAAALQPRLTPSVLASALAQAAAHDWYSSRTRELIALYAELSGGDEDHATAALHSATADIARTSPFGPALSAARYILLPPGESFEAEELAPPAPKAARPPAAARGPSPIRVRPVDDARAAAGTTPAKPAAVLANEVVAPEAVQNAQTSATSPQPAEDTPNVTPAARVMPAEKPDAGQPTRQAVAEDAYRECVHLLADVRRGKLPIQKALPKVVDALREGLGFERAVFAMKGREKPLLAARYTSGEPKQPALEVDLSRTNLITRMMQSQQGIWLHAGSREKLWPYLPRTLRAYAGERDFCAMSLFVRDKAVGMLYADYSGDIIDEQAYHRFKRVATELSDALSRRTTEGG